MPPRRGLAGSHALLLCVSASLLCASTVFAQPKSDHYKTLDVQRNVSHSIPPPFLVQMAAERPRRTCRDENGLRCGAISLGDGRQRSKPCGRVESNAVSIITPEIRHRRETRIGSTYGVDHKLRASREGSNKVWKAPPLCLAWLLPRSSSHSAQRSHHR